ncbi:MAG TPA: VOC family protein [Dongiaceae bacterium]|nr:VOC family protein [Dongiaceae bacterium]
MKRKKVTPMPKGYPGIIPYLVVENAKAAVAFYKKAFGAKMRGKAMTMGDKIGHAEMEIDGKLFMLADTFPERGVDARAASLFMYVPNVDAFYKKAAKSGATSREEPTDKFYGDRTCRLVDPFGIEWTFGTHVEDVSPEEMRKRMKNMRG